MRQAVLTAERDAFQQPCHVFADVIHGHQPFAVLLNLFRLLGRVEKGAVFVAENVRSLRRIALCCALAALICIPAGAVLYFPFACMGIAAGFMALIVQVLKNTFAQAVRMKDELDLTV